MKNLRRILMSIALPLAMAAPMAGCGGSGSASEGGSCAGGKCDGLLDLPDSEVPESPCDGFVVDKSGRGNERVAGRLSDPFAQHVLNSGSECPDLTLDGILERMREFDTEGCTVECRDGETDEECDVRKMKEGMSTRIVSETAQVSGEEEGGGYRAVITRRCDGRQEHDFMISVFGLGVGRNLPQDGIEVMAFQRTPVLDEEGNETDETNGVFNYYKTSRGQVNWLGNSQDMLAGVGQKDGQEVRECARCHLGGGPIMKELDTPWVHWEGHMDVPGARTIVDDNPILGRKVSGSNMERITKAGLREWNETRARTLIAQGNTQEILRPLFCDVEHNLDNGAGFESPVEGGPGGDEIGSIPRDAMFDPQIGGSSISIEFEDYDAAIKARGQFVPGTEGAIDTVFDLVFVERSFSDNDYLNKLKSQGVLDDELIKDVLMVDFTRPVFSEDRCELLQLVPGIPAAELNPQRIRAELLSAVASAEAGTPEGQLKANLESEGGHRDAVDAYVDACEALDGPTFVNNALTVIAENRNLARNPEDPRHFVFEFPATMPADNQVSMPGVRLSPESCELTNEFQQVSFGAAPQDEEPGDPSFSCVDRCGEVNPNTCSCDDRCEEFGNCCDDKADVCE